MKLYEYWLGLYPLDWEFCFMPVQTYKNFITEQYHKNPAFYLSLIHISEPTRPY